MGALGPVLTSCPRIACALGKVFPSLGLQHPPPRTKGLDRQLRWMPPCLSRSSGDKRHGQLCSQRRQWHPTPVLLPGKSHGRRSLVGCSPWGCEESDSTEQLHFHALEKEMATHSSVLAWRIPGTVEPDGLPSMESHRVRHD